MSSSVPRLDFSSSTTIHSDRDAELAALRAELQHTKQMLLAEETIRRMLERPALTASPSGGVVAAPPPRSVAAIIEQQPPLSARAATPPAHSAPLSPKRSARGSHSSTATSSSSSSSMPTSASAAEVALVASLTDRLAHATLQQQLALTSVESMKRLYAQVHTWLADAQAHNVMQAAEFAAELERERSMRRLIDEELTFLRRKLDAYESAGAAAPALPPDARQDLFRELRERVLDHTRSALEQEQREVAMLAESKRSLVEELEQLSQTLFEEANQMCSAANRAAHDAVVRGDELADQLSLTRMRLGLMQFAALRQASGADKSRAAADPLVDAALTPRGTKSMPVDASPLRAAAVSTSLGGTPAAAAAAAAADAAARHQPTRRLRREPIVSNINAAAKKASGEFRDDDDDDDEPLGATKLRTWSPQKLGLRRELSTGLPLPTATSLSTPALPPVDAAAAAAVPISDSALPMPLDRLACDNSLVRVLALPMGPQPARCSFAVHAKVTRGSSLAHAQFTAHKDGGAPLRQLRAAVDQCVLGAPPHRDARRALLTRLLDQRRSEPLADVAPPATTLSDGGAASDEACALCGERAAPPVFGLLLGGGGGGGERLALGAACFERVALALQLGALQRALRDAADDGTKSALFFELQRLRLLAASVEAWTADHCAAEAFNST
jgi:hypothetical protein